MAKKSPITGRYVYLDVDGVEYRVYYEESGEGIPILCQHTAGNDGRQYRHLLEDADITSSYRVIAYDLPYHGKSLPPASEKWWKQEHKLTEGFFKQFVLALKDALELEKPVFMGCSMGGHLAVDLALNYPEHFRACIALEGALESHDIQGVMPWWRHPRLSNDSKPSLMYTLMAPQSPEANKNETIWMCTARAHRPSSTATSTTTAWTTTPPRRRATSTPRRSPCTSSAASMTGQRRPRSAWRSTSR